MKRSVKTALFALAGTLLCLALVSCSGGENGGDGGERITLQGTGASFPFPIYDRWFKEYAKVNPSIRVNYQSTGSGAGVKNFIGEKGDFAASDAAMKDDEIAQVPENRGGVYMLPMTAGSVVLAYNLPGVENLKLSRAAYSGIFLGKITSWDDEQIKKHNPGVNLPSKPITIVRRADGSGTTYVFTKHLAAISEEWANGPGVGKSIEWLGNNVGGPKNDGVAALIKQTEGSIGYVEFAFSIGAKIPVASLENKEGKFVAPSSEGASAALGNAVLPENMRVWVSDPPGDASYPIVSYTWILAYKKYDDPKVAEALKKVLRWCLTDGQKISPELHYIPLPENITSKVLAVVDKIGE